MKSLAFLVLLVAACGGGTSGTIDAKKTFDAVPSSVKSVSCVGITPDATVTVTGTTQFMFSSSPTITVNQIVRFNTSSFHPVASGVPPTADGKFSTTGDGCFQFTKAGTFPFFCSVHQFTGTVTVN